MKIHNEWNLRGWHHPAVDTAPLGSEDFLKARDKNDDNATYTMADAVFSACFLNMVLRNADLVGMANFAPVVNTRGCIFTHDRGLVLRPTYHVFDLYVNHMGDTVVDSYATDVPDAVFTDRFGREHRVELVDTCTTEEGGTVALSLVNKHPDEAVEVQLSGVPEGTREMLVLTGRDRNAYNDVGLQGAEIESSGERIHGNTVKLPPHSVCILTARR